MIYDYYCTNCGRKIAGNDIVFDLAQILDLNSGQNSKSLFIKFAPDDLKEIAERNGKNLSDEKVQLKISIFDLLGYMGQDLEPVNQEALQGLTYQEFAGGSAMADLFAGSFDTQEVAEEKTRELVKAITNKFDLEEKSAPDIAQADWEADTGNYVMRFWVKTVFFEGTDEIYTLKYSCEEDPRNFMPIQYHTQFIRGYCPKCCEPVLDGSGKYEHILVGFLGGQKVGKTSLFVSMINYIERNNDIFDIQVPNLLCDGKYEKVCRAKEAHKYGWAVDKTDAGLAKEAYNASLLITKGGRRVLLSFVDIAGERCWDAANRRFNSAALKEFPLISCCHMYMLCEDVKPENEDIDANALIIIARDLYEQYLDNPLVKPPICLVVTKIDMAQGENNAVRQRNPFSELVRGKLAGKKGFDVSAQVSYLKDVYDSTNDREIQEALKECVRTYKEHRNMAYMSILGCSALGMTGRNYEIVKKQAIEEGEPAPDYKKDGDRFTPMNLEEVWRWILCSMGMIPALDNYSFSHIPSYGEGYKTSNMPWSDKVRLEYSEKEEKSRTDAIYAVYLNPSKLDEELHIFHEEDGVGTGLFGRLFGAANRENERLRIIENYAKNYRERE